MDGFVLLVSDDHLLREEVVPDKKYSSIVILRRKGHDAWAYQDYCRLSTAGGGGGAIVIGALIYVLLRGAAIVG